MMSRNLWRGIALSVAVVCTVAYVAGDRGERLDYDGMSLPIRISKSKVVWSATNDLPLNVAVIQTSEYQKPFLKLKPLFSALGLSGKVDPAVSNIQTNWQSAEGTTYLSYNSLSGVFGYSFVSSMEERERGEVPEMKSISEELIQLLVVAGLSTNELVRTPSGEFRGWRTEGTTDSWNEEKQARDQRIASRGVSFSRQFRGVEMSPIDSESKLEFDGEHLKEFTINWPALAVVEERPIARPEQILKWLEEGRCAIMDVETTGMRVVKAGEIESVEVTGARLTYPNDGLAEPGPGEPITWFPVMILDVELTLGPNDKEETVIMAPAMDYGLPRKRRSTSSGIGIYPTRRGWK